MSITRRGLLGGILAASFGPSIVRAGNIMPVKAIADHWSTARYGIGCSTGRVSCRNPSLSQIPKGIRGGTERLFIMDELAWFNVATTPGSGIVFVNGTVQLASPNLYTPPIDLVTRAHITPGN